MAEPPLDRPGVVALVGIAGLSGFFTLIQTEKRRPCKWSRCRLRKRYFARSVAVSRQRLIAEL
jgi:hypothetical protein